MATQTGILPFTGKLGNVIGYRRNGAYFMRSLPQTVTQTQATRQASRDFGTASRKGKLIRHAIAPLLDIIPAGSLVNRLNKTLIKHGKDLQAALTGFRWNSRTGTDQFFTRPAAVSPEGVVTIPAGALLAPDGATHLEIKLITTRISFATQQIIRTNTATVTIDPRAAFNGAVLHAGTPGKGTLLLILQVRVYKDGIVVSDRKSLAADIVAVLPPVAATPPAIKEKRTPALRTLLPYQPLKPVAKGFQAPVQERQRE